MICIWKPLSRHLQCPVSWLLKEIHFVYLNFKFWTFSDFNKILFQHCPSRNKIKYNNIYMKYTCIYFFYFKFQIYTYEMWKSVLPQRSVHKWDTTCVLIMRKGVCMHVNCTSSGSPIQFQVYLSIQNVGTQCICIQVICTCRLIHVYQFNESFLGVLWKYSSII